jgi:hypothetical protein
MYGTILVRLQLNVKLHNSRNIHFPVDVTDSVRSVKEKIEARTGLPIDLQRLTFRKRVMDDGDTLEQYQIFDRAWVQVAHIFPNGFAVYVHLPTNKLLPLTVEPHETVETLKEIISELEGIPKEHQRLLRAGRLLDEKKSLAECHLREGSDVVLEVEAPRPPVTNQ